MNSVFSVEMMSMGNEKAGCLGYTGDYTTHFFRDRKKPP